MINALLSDTRVSDNIIEYYELLNRYNADNTPHFLILRNGDLIKIRKHEGGVIFIILENVGKLKRDADKNSFIDSYGTIYNKNSVGEIIWRGERYWLKYTQEQYVALKELMDQLDIDNINLESDNNILSHSPNPTFDKKILYEI